MNFGDNAVNAAFNHPAWAPGQKELMPLNKITSTEIKDIYFELMSRIGTKPIDYTDEDINKFIEILYLF